jgi:hypothetical protein
LLFAICRGKAIEDLEFKDEAVRAMFVIGIPFPDVQDKRYIFIILSSIKKNCLFLRVEIKK